MKEDTRKIRYANHKGVVRSRNKAEYCFITVGNQNYPLDNGYNGGLKSQRDSNGEFVVIGDTKYYITEN